MFVNFTINKNAGGGGGGGLKSDVWKIRTWPWGGGGGGLKFFAHSTFLFSVIDCTDLPSIFSETFEREYLLDLLRYFTGHSTFCFQSTWKYTSVNGKLIVRKNVTTTILFLKIHFTTRLSLLGNVWVIFFCFFFCFFLRACLKH